CRACAVLLDTPVASGWRPYAAPCRPAVRLRPAFGYDSRRARLLSAVPADAAVRAAPRREPRAGPRAHRLSAARGAERRSDGAAVGGRAGDAAHARSRASLPRIVAVQVGLAIKNFVGPTETPDVDALYRYAERAEA